MANERPVFGKLTGVTDGQSRRARLHLADRLARPDTTDTKADVLEVLEACGLVVVDRSQGHGTARDDLGFLRSPSRSARRRRARAAEREQRDERDDRAAS